MTTMNFGATRNELIESALRKIGVIGENQNATAYQVQKASRALNSLVKNLGLNNQFVWRVAETTFNTVASTASYTPASGVVGVKSAFLRVSSVDTPLSLPNYDAWWISESAKSAEGEPTTLIFKDDRTSPAILLSPVPDGIYAVYYLGIYKLLDYDAASDSALVPAHWEEVLIWNLAATLAFEYGIPLEERALIMTEARRLKEEARLDNFHHQNTGDIRFEPA